MLGVPLSKRVLFNLSGLNCCRISLSVILSMVGKVSLISQP